VLEGLGKLNHGEAVCHKREAGGRIPPMTILINWNHLNSRGSSCDAILATVATIRQRSREPRVKPDIRRR